uniref:flagellar basal body-associated FliL family protein n=1 Tax=Castellaniella defragrans TaxID=75697 RepID=UPI0033406052
MSRPLKLALILIIVIGALAGAAVLVMSWQGIGPWAAAGAESTEPPSLPPAPIFTELAPFTVTLYGAPRNRILHVGVTLRLADQDSRKIIEDYMPEVRDRVLKALSSQDIAKIQSPDGPQILADALRTALTQPFEPLPAGPRITDVLFTAFVVQ